MTVQERFAKDWKMPKAKVAKLVTLAKHAFHCNEKSVNGDAFGTIVDKNQASDRWRRQLDCAANDILQLVKPYGFTGVEFTGLGPTLKRGEQFVEVPY